MDVGPVWYRAQGWLSPSARPRPATSWSVMHRPPCLICCSYATCPNQPSV